MIRKLLAALILLPTLAWATCPSDGYGATVCAYSPCHWYRMDASSGSTETDAGLGAGAESGACVNGTSNFTYSGTFALNQTGVVGGGADKAAGFSGTGVLNGGGSADDWSPDLTLNVGWTVEAWVKMVGTSGYIVSKDNATGTCGNQFEWYLYNNSGGLEFDIRSNNCTSGNYITLDGGSGLNDGNYHFVAATTLGAGSGALANVKLTIDGSQVASSTSFAGSPCNRNGSYPLHIAADAAIGSACAISATIDEVAFYHQQLSSSQLLAHYNAGIASALPAIGRRIFQSKRTIINPQWLPVSFGPDEPRAWPISEPTFIVDRLNKAAIRSPGVYAE